MFMKLTGSICVSIFTVMSVVLASPAFAQMGTGDFEDIFKSVANDSALKTSLDYIHIHPHYVGDDPNKMTKNGTTDLPKNFTQDINQHDPNVATFQDPTDKTFATEVDDPNGVVTQITQASKMTADSGGGYSYETLAIDKSTGKVSAFTFCKNVTAATAGNSDCTTATPALCGTLASQGVNDAVLNADLASCEKAEKMLGFVQTDLQDSNLKSATDTNVAALNNSVVKSYIFGGSLFAPKPSVNVMPTDPKKLGALQTINLIQTYEKVCKGMKAKKFMDFAAYNPNGVATSPADIGK
jgi:hypothetical protein